MRLVRLAVVCAAALVLTGSVQARTDVTPAAPKGLKAFLLHANEAAGHDFPRTPSFAWTPVRGAARYEFELAKNPQFSEGAVFWSSDDLRVPAASVPLALPWMTGSPYAVYARVRAITTSGVGRWSAPYGFNVRWSDLPKQLADVPGLSRWTSVEGASHYQVWFVDVFPGKVVATKTPAVDHREFYSFHSDALHSGAVRWRVRAVRNLFGAIPSGLPAVSHGPWSRVYTSVNPALAAGTVHPVGTYGDGTRADPAVAAVHRSTPAFSFSGTQAGTGSAHELYRVYAFSDADCVNVIFRGAIVGSPAPIRPARPSRRRTAHLSTTTS